MISHQYRCIFIHIPKCAGTSIEQVFGHLDGHSGRNGQDHRCLRMIERPVPAGYLLGNIENCKEVYHRFRYRWQPQQNRYNRHSVTAEQYRRYYKFTVIRNPWARAYSWYKNVMRDERHRRYYRIETDLSFAEFLPQFIGKGHLRPQTYWLKSFKGDLPFDFIARFENLHADFATICHQLNLDSLTLPHKIQGDSGDYREAYSGELIDLTSNIYQEDISLFNYSFEH